jgi:hypothetical protein
MNEDHLEIMHTIEKSIQRLGKEIYSILGQDLRRVAIKSESPRCLDYDTGILGATSIEISDTDIKIFYSKEYNVNYPSYVFYEIELADPNFDPDTFWKHFVDCLIFLCSDRKKKFLRMEKYFGTLKMRGVDY